MPRIGALRFSFSKHKASRGFLRKPRDEQSISKNTLAVTALYQRHSPEIRNLILSSNSRFLVKVTRGEVRFASLW